MILLAAALLSLAIWLFLVLAHGGRSRDAFWRDGPFAAVVAEAGGPPVAVVVPARDEAADVEAALRSLLAQDYRGDVRIWLVDDGSTDGTGAIARAIADPRLAVIAGAPRPPGWSGKLWAVAQGTDAANAWLERGNDADGFVLLTDADIVHDPTHLGSLVGHAIADRRDLVSEMVALRCRSAAERLLVPAFVFFFQLLYPFRAASRPDSRVAAAAGGVILVRAATLRRIGGIAAIGGALIDDVALARRVKRSGGRIWLGHARAARSLRPYPGAADVWRMVARTAYVQLRCSPARLAGTVAGLVVVWCVPLLAALAGHGLARLAGLAALALSLGAYLPTLRRFGLSPSWCLLLPFVAMFYLAATVGSALDHHRGRGVRWRNRAYAPGEAAPPSTRLSGAAAMNAGPMSANR